MSLNCITLIIFQRFRNLLFLILMKKKTTVSFSPFLCLFSYYFDNRILTYNFHVHCQTVRKFENESSTSAVLNQFDVCCFSSRLVHHTFTLSLDSGRTRVYAHVLRYLPTHVDIKTRYDVGRRSERAMVLITRAVGGVKFYASLLRYVSKHYFYNFIASVILNYEIEPYKQFIWKKWHYRQYIWGTMIL